MTHHFITSYFYYYMTVTPSFSCAKRIAGDAQKNEPDTAGE